MAKTIAHTHKFLFDVAGKKGLLGPSTNQQSHIDYGTIYPSSHLDCNYNIYPLTPSYLAAVLPVPLLSN
jgi:hypothetical protein